MLFVAYIEFLVIIFGFAIFMTLIRHLKNTIKTEKMKRKPIYYVEVKKEKASEEESIEGKSEEQSG